MRFLIPIFCLFAFATCNPNEVVISVDAEHFAIDMEKKLVLCQVDLAPYAKRKSHGIVKINLNDRVTWELVEKPTSLSAAQSYAITNQEQVFQLYFTNFPLIKISDAGVIQQESKSLATLTYAHDTLVIDTITTNAIV